MKYLILLLALLTGCVQAVVTAPTPPNVTRAASLTSKTVALVDADEDRIRVFCSGVWVSQTAILTAQHCVDDNALGDKVLYATHADVYAGGAAPSKTPSVQIAWIEKIDRAHDLALLRVARAPAHETAALSSAPILSGLPVQTMGHPRDLWWSYSRGSVSAVRLEDLGLDITWIQATAPISPGNSGGGLFDESGDLLGICSRGIMDGRAQGLNFWVHRVYLADFLR